MIRPPYLKKGDKIALTCPARWVDTADIETAVTLFKSWGLEVVLGETIGKKEHQYGGSDDERRADFQHLLDDTAIKAIIAARGGYGTVRMFDDLNFDSYMNHPKWIIGFSDITFLHAQQNFKLGVESMHAIMPLTIPGNSEASILSLKQALFGHKNTYQIDTHPLNRTGNAEAMLVGGNLSILYAMLGTSSRLNFENCTLFIEDLDEYLYHIDRMMIALKRAGKLKHLRGLIVGGMSDMKDNTIPFGKTAEEIIREHVEEYQYPVCFNFPAGHIADNRTLILGRKAILNVESNTGSFEQNA